MISKGKTKGGGRRNESWGDCMVNRSGLKKVVCKNK